MRILLLTMNPVMDESEMAVALFKNAGFSCDVATSGDEAFSLASKNRYDALWLEDSADRDMGYNVEVLISSLAQKNRNITCIGHQLTQNKWLVNTNRVNLSYFEGDWVNMLSNLYAAIKRMN